MPNNEKSPEDLLTWNYKAQKQKCVTSKDLWPRHRASSLLGHSGLWCAMWRAPVIWLQKIICRKPQAGEAGISASSKPWTNSPATDMQAFWGLSTKQLIARRHRGTHNLTQEEEPPKSQGQTNKQRDWKCSSMVEHLPGVQEVPSVILNWGREEEGK